MRSWIVQYQAILIGIVIGASAHFGRLINDHGWPSFPQIVGYLMQLGLVALVAAGITEQFHIQTATMQSVTAAIMAIAAHEVLKWARENASALLNIFRMPGRDS